VIVIPKKRLTVGTSSMLTKAPVAFGLPHPQDGAGASPAADFALAHVHSDHVAAAPPAPCSAVKAELTPTTPTGVCLLVGG
jgi:hypothetical protein